ncbi:hypothetical protein [Falsiroseomonas sp. CW058]|uniref:hypothetical protein n=1 Tax=Falsiroseomonas sp. CW058 TaxID=3388664 RepID=UPI003D318193
MAFNPKNAQALSDLERERLLVMGRVAHVEAAFTPLRDGERVQIEINRYRSDGGTTSRLVAQIPIIAGPGADKMPSWVTIAPRDGDLYAEFFLLIERAARAAIMSHANRIHADMRSLGADAPDDIDILTAASVAEEDEAEERTHVVVVGSLADGIEAVVGPLTFDEAAAYVRDSDSYKTTLIRLTKGD